MSTKKAIGSLSAQELQRLLWTKQPNAGARITRQSRGGHIPLSYAQQRLWIVDRFENAGTAYHIDGAVRLIGQLDVTALRRALTRVVERHESLRTRFGTAMGQPHQVIEAAGEFALREADLSGLPQERRDAALQGHLTEESQERFDLSAGGLIRGRLLKLSEYEHVLFVTMHHIVSDGWSLGVFIRELSALYSAYRGGQADPLPPLAIQYADYTLWQRQRLQGPELQKQLLFWTETLDGFPLAVDLPTDRSRPRTPSHRGAGVAFSLSVDLTRALRELCSAFEMTLHMMLCAALGVLLTRLSGQSDVVIGTPVANRTHAELESLIGFFVNTLPLRISVGDDPPVSALLRRVRELALEGYANQDVPFEQIVETVNPVRSLGRSPIFQVMLALQNLPLSQLQLPGLTLVPQPVATTRARFDLTLSLVDAGERIEGYVEYASDLFDSQTVQGWMDHWQVILGELTSNVSRRVSQVKLLTSAQREQVLKGFNTPVEKYEGGELLHERFEKQVRQRAQAVAVSFEGQQVTYEELNRRANRVAHWLLQQGVKPDDRVALCVERSVELVVGVLGILKSGAGYVPLDPRYPAERLGYMLRDSEPIALLLGPEASESMMQLQAMWPKLAMLRLDEASLSGQAESDPSARERGLDDHHLAYVIYTSGSTGEPKGVMVEHRQVVRLLQMTQKDFAFDEHDVWTLFHSIAFDFSVWELWGALAHGGRLVVVPSSLSRTPDAFYRLVCEEGVTVLNQTPSAFRQFSAAQEQVGGTHWLRVVILGGEKLEMSLLRGWVKRNGLSHPRVVNMYGITETTVHVTYRQITEQQLQESASNVGRRLADLRVYVLDREGEPVPIGVNGELYVGGAGVARGYLKREALTKERFVADRFSEEAGSRLYRTGDIGRFLADGSIEYQGRQDQQVKIRGFRIELGEIEAQLCKRPEVAEAVVVAREDEAPGEKRLVGYVVLKGQAQVTVAELRGALQEALPEHMVPAAIVTLERLPLTTNGKLDRASLPAPDGQSLAMQPYEAPQGEMEEAIAQVWQQLLRIERVGRHDNFFELGGHSMLAINVLDQLASLGIKISALQLLNARSLAALAEAASDSDGFEALEELRI